MPTKLFEGRYGAEAYHFGRTYDVSRDGQRFLMLKDGSTSEPKAPAPSMIVVLNWIEDLKRLVLTNGK